MDELAQPEYIHSGFLSQQCTTTKHTLLRTVWTNQMLLQFQEMQRLINGQKILHTAKKGSFLFTRPGRLFGSNWFISVALWRLLVNVLVGITHYLLVHSRHCGLWGPGSTEQAVYGVTLPALQSTCEYCENCGECIVSTVRGPCSTEQT